VVLAAAAVVAAALLVVHVTMPSWYVRVMPAWVARRVYPLQQASAIDVAAAKYRLDPALVAAVIYQESRFHQATTSPRGAVGLMQLLPSTAQEIARRTGGESFVLGDLKAPGINILYGCNYLRFLLDLFHGSVTEALAAYNAGVANVQAWIAADAGRQLSAADIPFAETRSYVRRVGLLTGVYRRAYGTALGPRPAGFATVH
jgi:soluble lytic murein transglycosylase